MIARRSTVFALLALLVTVGCDDDETSPTTPDLPDVPAAGAIFLDGFGENITFQAFSDSKVDAVNIDESESLRGSSSLRVTVPGPGDATGFFAGGAFTSSVPWNLSGYDALVFWARASKNATLNVAGLGNDNTGNSRYMVEASDLDVSGVWRKYVVPLPDPSQLSSEAGLFFFAEGHENDEGYTIWFDDIHFASLGTEVVRAGMTSRTLTLEVGSTAQVEGLTATVDAGGVEVTVSTMPWYFTFRSSDESVATVSEDGTITVVGRGAANITASLGSVQAGGSVTISTGKPLTDPAPTPPHDPADVISLFSGHYDNVPVDTWSAVWDMADVEDVTIAGDPMKLYTNLVFAGIEFTSQTIDATGMTHFHMDVWTPDATDNGQDFKVKLVDFGANGVFGGGDEVEHELAFTASTVPTLATGSWVSIDVPLTEFVNMTTRGHVAQLIISGAVNTVYVDNIYFYKGGAVTAPASPAPTPTYDPANVVSLFSDAYTDVPVDTWSASWDAAELSDETAGGDPVKKYSGLGFAGIEFTSQTVDASDMTHFRMDIWTPDETDAASFKVKLVDFGPNGVWEQGGDNVEHEVTLTKDSRPSIGTGSWFVLEIPLSDFVDMTTRGHVAQLIISGDLPTVFIDNVLFFKDVFSPAQAAPTPTHDPADVISLFSDAYTDVTVDTWSAGWDSADQEDVLVAGNPTKKYTNLVFAGIEFTSATIDASGMTHLRFDLWTPDPTADPAVFKVKLVDFGPNGVWEQGGDNVEHEITLDASSTPPLITGNWVSYDIPLSDFTNLTTTGALAQLIISGDPNTVFLDNIYLHK